MPDVRRAVPRTDVVLDDARLAAATRRLGRARVRSAVRESLQRCREGTIVADRVVEDVLARLPSSANSLRRVINASGVVVHTNLGRAPLSSAAREAVAVASGATNVEYDLETGRRARRGEAALQALSRAVPVAEAVHVVNNGAAALSLAAHALAFGREIVIARGELVEIGDGFRIPELLTASGARLREVGTTNRVHLDDYASAISDQTALVVKVHPSNFEIRGFTADVSAGELATLGVPVLVDIGSGLLRPHPRLPGEPDATSMIEAGAHLVTASGDKLLGGPQAGLILGREDLVQRLRRHPIARAFRVDKLTLAALEATLTGPLPPVLQALEQTADQLTERAATIVAALAGVVEARLEQSTAVVGGGGAPSVELTSAAIALPVWLEKPLRTSESSVVGHIARGRLLLDLIAVDPSEDAALTAAVRAAAMAKPFED
jgi:L-seryl-tRNA(Ser) seleniumtransferase